MCVLINGLPPGSAYGRARGGAEAWSEETSAALIGSWRVESAVLAAAGAGRALLPDPPRPPEVGWREKARRRQERTARKGAAWLARHPELSPPPPTAGGRRRPGAPTPRTPEGRGRRG